VEEERGLPKVDVVDLQSSLPLAKCTAWVAKFFSTAAVRIFQDVLISFETKAAAQVCIFCIFP
jgi:hypothetical protein